MVLESSELFVHIRCFTVKVKEILGIPGSFCCETYSEYIEKPDSMFELK